MIIKGMKKIVAPMATRSNYKKEPLFLSVRVENLKIITLSEFEIKKHNWILWAKITHYLAF